MTDARVPGAELRTWVCLQCARRLGDAGPAVPFEEAPRETQAIGPDDVGRWDP